MSEGERKRDRGRKREREREREGERERESLKGSQRNVKKFLKAAPLNSQSYRR